MPIVGRPENPAEDDPGILVFDENEVILGSQPANAWQWNWHRTSRQNRDEGQSTGVASQME